MWFMNKILCVFIFLTVTSFAHAEGAENISPWQLSLDVIQMKAQQLVTLNRQLTQDHEDLSKGFDKLKSSVDEMTKKNQALSEFLDQRAGRSDQQVLIEQTHATLKVRKNELSLKQKEMDDVQKKISDIQRIMNVKKFRLADWEIQKNAKENEIQIRKAIEESSAPTDIELSGIRKDVEKEKNKEAALEAKINELSKADSSQKLDVATIRKENSQLQRQLDGLLGQIKIREQLDQRPLAVDPASFNEMMARKKDLEEKIHSYETRIEAFKNPQNFRLSWEQEKKKKIHALVQADARNQQIRNKIEEIKEDISLLRENVAKYERRMNFEKSPQRR